MQGLRRFCRILLISFIIFQMIACSSFADTVIMKDRESVKGVVVEEYQDRIVLSTIDGEKSFLRENIGQIVYDLEEQNLANMGDFYSQRGMYKTANHYYEEALKINPNYKKAQDGIVFSETYLKQTVGALKRGDIQKKNQAKQWQEGIEDTSGNSEAYKVKKALGIEIENVNGRFVITSVLTGSSAAVGGLNEGDIILAVWGRAISYMDTGEAMRVLLGGEVLEVRLLIERSIVLDLKETSGNYTALTGLKLGFSEMEGMTVEEVSKGSASDKAGIEKGDILVKVQDEDTRYMSIREVENIIKANTGKRISLTIERNAIVWKKLD